MLWVMCVYVILFRNTIVKSDTGFRVKICMFIIFSWVPKHIVLIAIEPDA